MCAEVELILIQISFLFFWRSLSFPKKNFKKNLWDQGKEGHKKDVIYIIREKGLIKTGSTPVSFPPKQAPKAESLTNKRAKLCSQTTVGWKCNLLVWLSEHSRNNNLQKSSQCMHEAKFSHIICDKKINLLKAFCRWVWRFFYSGHRSAWTLHSQVTLLYISEVETCLTCLFRHKAQEDHSDKAKQVENWALRRQSCDPLVGS